VKWQETEYYCGPASLSAAFRVMGVRVSQANIARSAATTEAEGTDELGIQRAALAHGFGVDLVATSNAQDARSQLRESLLAGRTAVICTHRWTHWVAVLGVNGDKFLLFDPARTLESKRTGVSSYGWKRLSSIWEASYRTRGKGPKYYGVIVCPA
jgi:ABC-type bacteriocin/lantibiotic exporter with double-glycine peptidase domain